MKIISAIGSFKGSITSRRINEKVKEVLSEKGFSVSPIPVADGGDGLLEALSASISAEEKELETVDALGRKIRAKVAFSGRTAIAEMALTSGLAILKKEERNPLKASTYGTGILIKKLAFSGAETLILGIGGSATNDGGMGALAALGFEFFGEKGELLTPSGESLKLVRRISGEKVPEEIRQLKIEIACDVNNPLLGENGATYIYGPQKGADEKTLAELENGMENYKKVVAEFCGCDYSLLSGMGAAGGLSFGLTSLLGAELKPGAEVVLEKAFYSEKLKDAALVITGEGRLDYQTEMGKLPQIVASKAKEAGVKCIALCGSNAADSENLHNMGISEVYELIDFAPFEECMNNTEFVVEKAVSAIALKL